MTSELERLVVNAVSWHLALRLLVEGASAVGGGVHVVDADIS
jgi:hypothetical protein